MPCNTCILTSTDGSTVEFPLSFLIQRKAILADRINGADASGVLGCSNQLWIPGFPAKYFLRDVETITFETRDEPPALPDFTPDGMDYQNRPNVSCGGQNICRVGEAAVLEGYADDFDKRIVAVEVSFDEGQTWSRGSAEGTDSTRWVWWQFEWTPEERGRHKVLARAVNEDGKVSPIPACWEFEVE